MRDYKCSELVLSDGVSVDTFVEVMRSRARSIFAPPSACTKFSLYLEVAMTLISAIRLSNKPRICGPRGPSDIGLQE